MALDVLIVDDELDIRELVAGVLEDEGYGARTAADSDRRRPAMTASGMANAKYTIIARMAGA